MKNYVVGDIHGRYAALLEVLRSSKFNYVEDHLIVLGDIVDGGEQTRQCFDELLKIKHVVVVLGNHDAWALQWMRTGDILPVWWNQGGIWTAKSYGFQIKNVPHEHVALLEQAEPYYEFGNMLFVHGGFDPHLPIERQDPEVLMWDRDVIERFRNGAVTHYEKVFIGHTTVQLIENDTEFTEPLRFGALRMLDTGAGWSGRLTIMNIDTEQFWQSEVQSHPEDSLVMNSWELALKPTE